MSSVITSHSIFISHTHADQALADAMRDAVRELFGERITVHYSTNKELGGGISPGAEWFRWIADRVRESNVALVLLTPASVQKPWILWEAGAVAGTALATSETELRKVRPLLFQLAQGDAPSPFTTLQLLRGDSREDIERFFLDLLDEYGDLLSRPQVIQVGQRLGGTIEAYLQRVETALLNAPLLPTEAAVQEWCLRLDEVRLQGRMSEVIHIHDWLNVAFGRERGERARPLDLRIHRRLGQLYLSAKKHEQAIEQFELARQLAPRDIFILRSLGQAYLGRADYDSTGRVIEQISKLDPEAFWRNAECAALKGRWHREQNDIRSATEVYEKALQHNPRSYYLADLLGQMHLDLGDRETARRAYQQALTIIRELDETNVWIHATAATAAIVLGNESEAMTRLRAVATHKPTRENLASIEGGLRRIKQSLDIDDATFDSWCAALRQ